MRNRNFVSDPTLNAMLAKVDSAFDDAQREKTTQDAVRYAMRQQDALPLFFVKASWGARKDLTLSARAGQYTLATTVRKTP